MNRRELLKAGVSAAAASTLAYPGGVFAQAPKEITIGIIYPMSGSSAQVGVDARNAFDTALDIINNDHPLDLIMAKGAGLAALGGAKIRLVYADHQADPQKGRSEAERLITQEKVSALVGCYHSAVSATVSVVAERYGVPFLCADSSSPSLQRRNLKFFFRPAAEDEMFSGAMFDFFDLQKKKGKKVETIGLFFEDTIFGVDSSNIQRKLANERGYKIVADIKYRTNSPSLTAEVQQLKNADPDVLMPSSYTTDAILLVKTMAELGYKPKNLVAQASGFSEKATYDAIGDKVKGAVTRASFSLDLAAKRPFIATINEMFKARAQRELTDSTSRQFMGLLLLAEAINRAGSVEGPKVRDALAATDIPGTSTIMPWSRVKYGPDGQNPHASPVLLQYVGDNKFATIFPTEVAIAEAIWPMNG